MRLTVTGGLGFLGRRVVRRAAARGDRVLVLDAHTYAADPSGFDDLAADERERIQVVRGDVCDPDAVAAALADADGVVHAAAETHVDRSIEDAAPFVRTNVEGTRVVLEAVRAADRTIPLVHVSTDEVYGSLGPGDPPWTPDAAVRPRNPYSATKAAADHLVNAWVETHGVHACITRGCNTYGPGQHDEKLIPTLMRMARAGSPLPIYGDGEHVREWLHVDDHARGILAALEKAEPGSIHHFASGDEHTNLEVARRVCRALGADESLITLVDDRPGHDRRYALDWSATREALDWRPQTRFGQGLTMLCTSGAT